MSLVTLNSLNELLDQICKVHLSLFSQVLLMRVLREREDNSNASIEIETEIEIIRVFNIGMSHVYPQSVILIFCCNLSSIFSLGFSMNLSDNPKYKTKEIT